ncbi:MAG: ABC transporter permease subunit [Verrucomicrobiia bacterium]
MGIKLNNVRALSRVSILEMYRRKDFYVVLILTVLLTLALGSMNFFNEANITGYVKEICLLLIWVFALVIAVTSAARQIPSEVDSRTIFPLLAKPVTRSEVLIGKALGCWLATGAALLVFYFIFGLLTAAREHSLNLPLLIQALISHWIMIGVVISMAFLGSVVFAAPSSNTTICFVVIVAIMILGRHLHKLALGMSEPMRTIVELLYFSIPHIELFDLRDLLVHNYPPAPWGKYFVLLIYGVAYSAIFIGAGCVVFNHKRLR